VDEIRRFLSGIQLPGGGILRVASIESLPPGQPVEEVGDTFAENARLKALLSAARALALRHSARPAWVLADDSGLRVDALGGSPGVRSARYAGASATDAMNNGKLLQALRDVPQGARGAEFVCALALVDIERDAPQRLTFTTEGRCRGEILPAERGGGGFGYDPLFFVPEAGKTFAELSDDEKNRWSHRGKALQSLRQWLAPADASAGAAGTAAAGREERR
jgi:XTP/dITP diphosphohydrolase